MPSKIKTLRRTERNTSGASDGIFPAHWTEHLRCFERNISGACGYYESKVGKGVEERRCFFMACFSASRYMVMATTLQPHTSLRAKRSNPEKNRLFFQIYLKIKK
ncbi:MAG: hypothetical protein LBE71_01565 [Dysgonamonadaceae bacterium]|nr:hypothetical protein [Dysgonamonadaceae bacterium]